MAVFCYIGAVATCLLFFVAGGHYLLGGLLLIVANLSFGASIVLYNAYLTDITTEDQRDSVSSRGFALGYLGGGLLLAANLALVLVGAEPLRHLHAALAVRLSLLSAGVWWGGFALITFARLQTRRRRAAVAGHERICRIGFSELGGDLPRAAAPAAHAALS